MLEIPPPSTWTFELDPLAPRMSLIEATRPEEIVFATPDTVNQVVATFDRSEATPEEVVALLEVSRKLLRTSFVHYEFAAIAAEKSIQALELAVRTRLGASKKDTFEKLIDRLPAQVNLTDDDVRVLHAARLLRNRLFAHPTSAVRLTFVMAVDLMRTSHRYIARLFSDS